MELQITTLISDGEHERALQLMAQQYGVQLGRFCTGLVGSSVEAQDLLQDTFIQVWKAIPRFRGESTVKTWLYSIAKKVCASHLRKRDRRSGLLKRFFWGKPDEVTQENPELQTETQTLLNEALSKIKPHLREAVLLFYQTGMKSQEIAITLDISNANARKRVSLGVKELRKLLRSTLMEQPESRGEKNEKNRKKPMSTNSGLSLISSGESNKPS
jgi:RNA polymerase sigma-70 factor, ECF subfamily